LSEKPCEAARLGQTRTGPRKRAKSASAITVAASPAEPARLSTTSILVWRRPASSGEGWRAPAGDLRIPGVQWAAPDGRERRYGRSREPGPDPFVFSTPRNRVSLFRSVDPGQRLWDRSDWIGASPCSCPLPGIVGRPSAQPGGAGPDGRFPIDRASMKPGAVHVELRRKPSGESGCAHLPPTCGPLLPHPHPPITTAACPNPRILSAVQGPVVGENSDVLVGAEEVDGFTAVSPADADVVEAAEVAERRLFSLINVAHGGISQREGVTGSKGVTDGEI
jgi:hypothetical protein